MFSEMFKNILRKLGQFHPTKRNNPQKKLYRKFLLKTKIENIRLTITPPPPPT